MYSNPVAAKHQPEPMYFTGFCQTAALPERTPVCLDVAATSGATVGDGSGLTIPDNAAVGSYFAVPATTNAQLFAGVTGVNDGFAVGDCKRIITAGPCRVAVRNTGSASMSLAVGDGLIQVPGQSYLIPTKQSASAGTSLIISNHGAVPRAIVTKAATIGASTTAYVYVFLFPMRAPSPVTWNVCFNGAAPGTITACPLGVTRGYGWIARVGLGVATGGNAGNLTLDVLIAAVSCLTTAPKIDNDCVDPFHSLKDTGATTAGPGTAGVYGLVNTAANTFGPNTTLTYTLTNTSSFVGTHVNIQVEGFYY